MTLPPLSRVFIPRTFHSSLYGSLMSPILSSLSFNPFKYFLSSSILCQSFLSSSSFHSSIIPPYIHVFLLPSSLRMDFYYILRIGFSSIVSSFLLSVFSIPCHISYCPIHRAIWQYTF